jgi:hypothetical protein
MILEQAKYLNSLDRIIYTSVEASEQIEHRGPAIWKVQISCIRLRKKGPKNDLVEMHIMWHGGGMA